MHTQLVEQRCGARESEYQKREKIVLIWTKNFLTNVAVEAKLKELYE
jgi:hypothetical protein